MVFEEFQCEVSTCVVLFVIDELFVCEALGSFCHILMGFFLFADLGGDMKDSSCVELFFTFNVCKALWRGVALSAPHSRAVTCETF